MTTTIIIESAEQVSVTDDPARQATRPFLYECHSCKRQQREQAYRGKSIKCRHCTGTHMPYAGEDREERRKGERRKSVKASKLRIGMQRRLDERRSATPA